MIELDDDMREKVDSALAAGRTVVIGYVGDDGAPHLSLRGTTQVFGPDSLAVWARDANGGLVKAIETRPGVELLYASPEPPRIFKFKGRARVDPTANDVVYANAPAPEREKDPERKGVAVIVELDEVTGLGASGPFRMVRS